MRRSGSMVGVALTRRSRASRAGGWALAILGPFLVALAARPVRGSLGVGGYEFLVLVVVTAAALAGGVVPGLVAVVVGALIGAYDFTTPYDSFDIYLRLKNAPLVAFILVGAVISFLVDELARLVAEQTGLRQVEASLRRVATLAASAAPAGQLFRSAAEEVARLLPVQLVRMGRTEADGSMTLVAGWAEGGDTAAVGSRWPVEPGFVGAAVLETGRAARADGASSAVVAGGILRESEIRSAVAAPISVGGRLWGVIAAGSTSDRPLPRGTEARLADITELLAMAIANAQSLDELAASRRRVVAAADDARRRIERDLHDGAQQQLVTLAIELRNTQASVPPEAEAVSNELSRMIGKISEVQDELREISRGIHPALLAAGGIGPAVRTLARRSAIPVRLDANASSRLPPQVEVATYYVVSEAITNATKHANASVLDVKLSIADGSIRISIGDDGDGGADPDQGSGLVGLKDRVEALGGTLVIRSPVGAGTNLEVTIPCQ